MAPVSQPKSVGPQSPPVDVGYAKRVIDQPCFHRSTTYTSPVDGRTLKVSFAVTSNFDDDKDCDLPTILYLGPMMCSRYLLCMLDSLACLKGVRVIFLDRPGFGSSDPVLVEERLTHALACIPNVLTDLHVKHISLLSASAGTLYSLNFLVTPSLRAFLHPQHPYIAALVPWVHPNFSTKKLLSTAAMLPAALIGSCGALHKFVGTAIFPGISWSGGILTSIVSAFNKVEPDDEADDFGAHYGIGETQFKELNDFLLRRVCAEDTSGLGHEALLLLQKNVPLSTWGAAASYPNLVCSLRDSEIEILRQAITPSAGNLSKSSKTARSRLRFRTIFASSDVMIGDPGRHYFDACFKDCDGLDEAVEYTSSIIENSNHDSMMDIRTGALGMVFDDVKALWGGHEVGGSG